MNEVLDKQIKNGYGFEPAKSEHHYVVNIPRGGPGKVLISEHVTFHSEVGSCEAHVNPRRLDGQTRVELTRQKWDLIAEAVRVTFNLRLRKEGFTAGGWTNGKNLLRRELGRELCVLVWAIEDTESANIDRAIQNWQGLTAEERWWLYTQTAATGMALTDKGAGWRVALRYALAESEPRKRIDYEDIRSELADPPLVSKPEKNMEGSEPYYSDRNLTQQTMLGEEQHSTKTADKGEEDA